MLLLQQDVVALLFPNRKVMCTLKLLDVHKVAIVIAASHDFLAQTEDQTCSAENPKLCSAKNPKLCFVENPKLCSAKKPKPCSDTSLKAARGLGFRSKTERERV